jgi:hypothetical protein
VRQKLDCFLLLIVRLARKLERERERQNVLSEFFHSKERERRPKRNKKKRNRTPSASFGAMMFSLVCVFTSQNFSLCAFKRYMKRVFVLVKNEELQNACYNKLTIEL